MDHLTRICVTLSGCLQGVGFRPFVLRLAHEMGLTGWVRNERGQVTLEMEGLHEQVQQCLARLRDELPRGAQIDLWRETQHPLVGHRKFCIEPSCDKGEPLPGLLPDLAPCPDCWAEWNALGDRRFHYPFIACTSCGPRFSVIEHLPFDRAGTSCSVFPLCESCAREYHCVDDRRCHCQTMHCPDCGPQLRLLPANLGGSDAIGLAAEILREGGILALQSVGGFQLLADARNAEAVQRLRDGKQRPWKPLAVLVQSRIMAQALAHLSPDEWALMSSPPAPIVLSRARGSLLANAVHPDNPMIGLMLPPSPLHRLLIEAACCPLVATSGNLADEPICMSPAEAEAQLSGVADAFLVHNRHIAQRLDDSLAQIVAGKPQLIRRARGYVPEPVRTPIDLPDAVALGAYLKNTLAFSHGRQIVLSQHLGDLDSVANLDCQSQTLAAQLLLYNLRPRMVALDAHPDTPLPAVLDRLNLPLSRVPHHRAHVAAVMAEHGLAHERLLALAWDGYGHGDDGGAWGGEAFLVEKGRMKRVASILPFPLPGGDRAASEPRRVLLGLMFTLLGPDAFDHALIRARFRDDELTVLSGMLMNNVHCPLTSSVGRLFDALASLLDLRQIARFEGEAAQQVQFAAEREIEADSYPFAMPANAVVELDWRPMLSAMLIDVEEKQSVSMIAARFHATLCEWALAQLELCGCRDLVLAGGCFHNRLLVETIDHEVKQLGGRCWWPQRIPAGDGGLALGQIYYLALQGES